MSWMNERFQDLGERPVAIGQSGPVTYAAFAIRIGQWRATIQEWGIAAGDRVALVADYHIEVVALLQALIDSGCIVVPLSEEERGLFGERLATACANWIITVPGDGEPAPGRVACRPLAAGVALHPLLARMAQEGRPGFVIFTSGTTGKGKAVLLDHGRMTAKYRQRVGKPFRTLLFLKLDHIAGLNSLFSVMFNGGTIVICASRQAREICDRIEKAAVEAFSTTPSFLTMLLMSGLHKQHDLSSLRVINYGTEVMPDSTLAGLHQAFPDVDFRQGYGLSELGVLPTRSKDSASRWMRIGGHGYEVKVEGGTLRIRSGQAMVGYLNAPNPFDADGWYDTGDRVEVDGEYFRILGRESEIINVGGEKVFPAEVENFLLTLDNVKDVVVREKRSPVVGQLIWAEFLLAGAEDPQAFKKRIAAHCRQHLAPFKVPGLITIAGSDSLAGSRFKKIRKTGLEGPAPGPQRQA